MGHPTPKSKKGKGCVRHGKYPQNIPSYVTLTTGCFSERHSFCFLIILFLGNKMKRRFRISVSDSGLTKATVAIVAVAMISAIAVASYYYAMQQSSRNTSPTPTPSSNPVTPSPTPTPITTPTPTHSASPTPAPTSSSSETLQEKIRDSIMNFIESNHPETAQFINDLAWTGGRVTPENFVGAETYMYYSLGWNFTLSYPVVPNAIYTIEADYSAVSIGIPYRVIWEGTWQNEVINETSYVFAQ
jgi:hypothetical protein